MPSVHSWVFLGIIIAISLGTGWLLRKYAIKNALAWWIMGGITVASCVVFASYSIFLYTHFEAHARDLGIFDQAIWNVSRFHAPASTIRGVSNLLGDHFHPLIFILAPFYWIITSPVVLLITQAVLFASLMPLTYLTARSFRLSAIAGIIIAAAATWNIGTLLALSFDFHEIAFSAPLFLGVILFAQKKKWLWFWMTLLALLLTKESMGAYAVGIGFWLLTKRDWRRGVLTALVGLAAFAFISRIVIPTLADNHTYYYDKTYASISRTTLGLPFAVLRHPVHAASEFVNDPGKRNTIKWTLGSYAGLPLLAPPFWPLIILTYAERFWASNVNFWLLQFHYQVMMNVVFAIATLTTLQWWIRRAPKRAWLVTSAVIVILALTVATDIKNEAMGFWNRTDIQRRPVAIWNQALRVIPKTAPVSAQDGFASHLSDRTMIVTYPTINNAQYIILDPLAPRFPMTIEDVQQQQASLRLNPQWEVVFDQGSTTVFHRR